MVSFADPRDIELVAEICQSFALDNGAFVAWKTGSTLDLNAYIDWAALWLRHPGCDWALIPDAIEGSEEDNERLLATAVLDPRLKPFTERLVPVWHLHESIERLDVLMNAWPRVALGSSGDYAEVGSARWWCRMAIVLDVLTDAEGFPRCKIHGLRMLDNGLFAHIPFASADSTNVARNIGLDVRWSGPYVPPSQHTRALVIIDRIEAAASARSWNRMTAGVGWNLELLG